MPTIAAGNTAEIYVPLACSVTFTPGTNGRIEFSCSSPSNTAPDPRVLIQAATIDIPAGTAVGGAIASVDYVEVDNSLSTDPVNVSGFKFVRR